MADMISRRFAKFNVEECADLFVHAFRDQAGLLDPVATARGTDTNPSNL